MSDNGKREIAIRIQQTSVPEALKRVTSLTDLFNLAAGDNISALEQDLEAAGWPSLEDIDNPEIDAIIEDFLSEIDVNDIKTIQHFGESALKDFEKLYRRFSQNYFLNTQLSQASEMARNGAKLDAEDLLGRLAPLYQTKEEKSEWRQFFDRYNPFAEEEADEITPQDIIREATEVELDLNAQTTQLAGMASKSRRLIVSLQMQKENLQNAYDSMQNAEIMLFLAYSAGRQILTEWHSDDVVYSYVDYSALKVLSEDEMPDTEFHMPNNAQVWADSTHELNTRLMMFHNAYTNSRDYLNNIPKSIEEIDQLIEFYVEVEQQLGESWKNTADDIRNNVEFIRTQVAIKKLMARADDLVTASINHDKFMQKVEPSYVKSPQPKSPESSTQEAEAPAQESVYERIKRQSEKMKAEFKEKAEAIDAQFTRLCDTSDYYSEKLGQDKIKRPENGLIETVTKSKQGKPERKKGLFGF